MSYQLSALGQRGLLNGEIFCTLREFKASIERWRTHCDRIRP